MRIATALCALALVFGVAACGGGETSTAAGALTAADYDSQLDSACATYFKAIRDLPQTAEDQNLSDVQTQQLADKESATFESTLAALVPPAELADAHKALVALGDQAPTDLSPVGAYRDYLESNVKAFETVGASGCADNERQAIADLPQN